MNTAIFREHLRMAMAIRQATQSDVETQTGVSQATISRLLTGANPHSDTLFKLWDFIYGDQAPAAPDAADALEEARTRAGSGRAG